MDPFSRQDACKLVEELRFKNGGLSASQREEAQNGQNKYLVPILHLGRLAGKQVGLLARDLYSTHTRFVYELIQNADDNCYSRITAENNDPFLHLTLYPDKMVIDSNEDGFTPSDVESICSIGESTKKREGYIGEKGIGFKSVFKVAKKVHVQSEPFSFSFISSGDMDDNGLGMITPIPEEYGILPANVQTRFTLTLHALSDFDKRAEDLQNIPDTLLLFLKKLRSLHVTIHPRGRARSEVRYLYKKDESGGLEKIVKEKRDNGGFWRRQEKLFHVFRQTETNLPYDEKRKGRDQATVVLAFPVTGTGRSVLEHQHVFAYLPLRQVGFKFLIQSDFVVQANREDVFHSPRNEALLQGVAEAFRDVALSFRHHPLMQYQWMQYIPSESISDEFWKKLKPKITEGLRGQSLVKSRSGRLCCPNQLSWVPEDCRDKHGVPLFPDLKDEKYLADGYLWESYSILKPIGSTKLQWDDLIDRVAADLDKPGSKMKGPTTDDDWHSRAARLLLELLASDKPEAEPARARLKSLRLIPLIGNTWASGIDTVYFAMAGKASVPTDLGKKLVSPASVVNFDRKKLFSHLGVKESSTHEVIPQIREKYKGGLGALSIAHSISHLQYLFWNLPGDQQKIDFDIRLITQDGALRRPDDIYFPDSIHEYCPKDLFRKLDEDSLGFKAKYLADGYLTSIGKREFSHGRSWRKWLEEVIGVQAIPKLINRTGLSKDFKYIISHRPERLFGLLAEHWLNYEPAVAAVKDEIYTCWESSHLGNYRALASLYMPFPTLKNLAHDLGNDNCGTFLPIPGEPREDEAKWVSLKRFGVRFTDDLDFYLDALVNLAKSSFPAKDNAVFKIYKGILRNCVTTEDISKTQTTFEQNLSVFFPTTPKGGHSWQTIGSCVWGGPEWLKFRPSISKLRGYDDVGHLFQTILKLRNAEWKDGINELLEMQKRQINDFHKMTKIYRYLFHESENGADDNEVRAKFENYELVFVPLRNVWRPLSSCIWARENVRFPGYTSIGTPYPSLEEFFTRVLGVPKPDLAMTVKALLELSKQDSAPAVEEIKEFIVMIGTMNPNVPDLISLRSAEFLPVKLPSGEIRMAKPSSDFAIVDRKEYGEAFEGKLTALHLSQTEVHACRNVLLSLGLETRFMSQAVDETTTVKKGIPNSALTEDFRKKSYALFRTKARGKDRSLLKLLQQASIHVSNSISKSIRLIQGSSTYAVDDIKANFHMDHADGQLSLYVPADKQDREVCYLQELPKRFLEFLCMADQTAETLLVKLLGSSSLDIVDSILENAGIVEVEGVGRPAEIVGQAGGSRQRSDSAMGITRQPSSAAPDNRFNTRSGNRELRREATPVTLVADDLRHHEVIDMTSPITEERDLAVELLASNNMMPVRGPIEDAVYAFLLDRIIKFGGRAFLPTSGHASHCFCEHISHRADARCSDHHELYRSILFTRSQDRDRKAGAAGELFVFELLLNMGLTGFSADNWKSTIRKEVRVCGKYAHLEAWTGSETSDFVYHDSHGELTKQLQSNGYFDDDAVSVAEHPTYYIEVKTTTGECEEPFYMSNAQVERMNRLALRPETPASEVYVLIRVFDIERESIGLRVYVDPERDRRARRLDFSANTWIVKQPTTRQILEALVDLCCAT